MGGGEDQLPEAKQVELMLPSTVNPNGHLYSALFPSLYPSNRRDRGGTGSGSFGQVEDATTIEILFVRPLGEEHVKLPESCGVISLIVSLYLVDFSSGFEDHAVEYFLCQLVQDHSGDPLALGYMQSKWRILPGRTAKTPEGSKAPDPDPILMRTEGGLSSEKFVRRVVGTQEGIRGAHNPLEHKTLASPNNL